MAYTLDAHVRDIWQKLQHHYQWSLVNQQDRLIGHVTHSLEQAASPVNETQIKLAIQQAYAQELHNAVIALRENQGDRDVQQTANLACEDIYLMAFRRALNLGVEEELACDIAQQVVEALITAPERVREPKALFTWVWYQVRDFASRKRRAKAITSLEAPEHELSHVLALTAPHNISAESEAKIFAQTVLELLPSLLSPFQQQIIDLVCFQELTPRQTAAILNTSAHRIRVEKSRALAKIRSHPCIQPWLNED